MVWKYIIAHGAYPHQFYIVWIPKYRKNILKGELKEFLGKRLFNIQVYHPDILIEKYNIQQDHLHLVMVIPSK